MALLLRFPVRVRALVFGCVLLVAAVCAVVLPAGAAAGGDIPPVCAVKPDKTVWCWGYSEQAFAGLRGVPQQVPGAVDARSAAVTSDHGCLLTTGGSVRCWGRNSDGQLGDGSTTTSTTPVAVAGLSDARSVSVSYNRSCAAKTDGTVWCWGNNNNGNLGVATSGAVSTPEQVPGIQDATSVSLGNDHRCAVRAPGGVLCWGENYSSQLGDGSTDSSTTPVAVSGLTDVLAVSAGDSHSCAVKANGTVWCWGRNRTGQLGDGTTNDSSVPVQVVGIGDATAVQASDSSSCAVRASGTISCWGAVTLQQLMEAEPPTLAPVAMAGYTDAESLIAVVFGTVCAQRSDGGVLCSGMNFFGNLGNGRGAWRQAPDREVQELGQATDIAMSEAFACGLRSSGAVRCWGFGPFGDGATSEMNVSYSAASVPGASANVESFGVGESHGCAVMGDQTVKCLGSNSSGRLGDGTTTDSFLSPVTVSGLSDAVAVAGGGQHSCALRAGGTVVCWGRNDSGQLGDGSTASSSTPVAVSGMSDATAISLGRYVSCAARTAGTVSCWGEVPGSGTSSTPTDIGVTNVASMSAGRHHVCVAHNDGTASCIGRNDSGELGDGTTTDSSTPVTVSGLNGVTSITASEGGDGGSSCAVAGGEVSCWGFIGALSGDVDLNVQPVQSTPVKIAGLSNITKVATSALGACALKQNGDVACWGFSYYGHLFGDGPGPLGSGPQDLPRCVIGFCSDEPDDDGTGDGGGGGSDSGTTNTPPAADPPVVLPPKPPAGRVAVPQIRFTGRALVFTNYRVHRRGKNCPASVTAAITAGGRTISRPLKVTRAGGVCLIKAATITLPKNAAKAKTIKLRLSGRGVTTRTIAVKQTR